VCGRIQLEHVNTIGDLIVQEKGGVALDLTEVTIVDRETVNLFAVCALKVLNSVIVRLSCVSGLPKNSNV
jgi:hypothetical protein